MTTQQDSVGGHTIAPNREDPPRYRRRRLVLALATALATVCVMLVPVQPAAAHTRGWEQIPFGVGYFYGTFNEDPNTLMLVGGRAEDFCEANPEDAFGAEPGSATARIRTRRDGTVQIRVNSKDQPFHVYTIPADLGAPPWISQVCATYFETGHVPEPFASGHARLRVRIEDFGEGNLNIFNAAKGRAFGPDGERYKVSGSADFEVRNGQLVGNPPDFVKFSIRQQGNHH